MRGHLSDDLINEAVPALRDENKRYDVMALLPVATYRAQLKGIAALDSVLAVPTAVDTP